jgi:hypothetical protein
MQLHHAADTIRLDINNIELGSRAQQQQQQQQRLGEGNVT